MHICFKLKKKIISTVTRDQETAAWQQLRNPHTKTSDYQLNRPTGTVWQPATVYNTSHLIA